MPTDSPTTPPRRRPENPLDSTNIRGKLLWTPGALPGFEARAGFTHFKRYGGYSFSYTDTSVPDFFDHRRNSSDLPNDSDVIATLDLRYDIGSGLTLTAISSYNDVKEYNRHDNDLTAADGGVYLQRNRFKTSTQELRLNFESERMSGLVGAFYYDRKNRIATTSETGVPTPIPTISGLLQQSAGLDAVTANFIAGLYGQALPVIPDILLLKHLQPLHLRRHQPAIFAAPSVVGLDRYAGLPANFLNRRPVLGLLEDERDLLLAEPRLLHRRNPSSGTCQT